MKEVLSTLLDVDVAPGIGVVGGVEQKLDARGQGASHLLAQLVAHLLETYQHSIFLSCCAV